VRPAASLSPAGRQGTGRQTTVSLNNDTGRIYQAEYRLRELADVQPSHSGLSFGPNPKCELVNDRDYFQPENQARVFNGATPARFNAVRLIDANPNASEGAIVVDSQGNAQGCDSPRHDLAAGLCEQPGRRAVRRTATHTARVPSARCTFN
jgi:hypothetical protein